MLLHFRVNSPHHLTPRVLDAWLTDDVVTDVALYSGVSRQPEGDVIEADIAREAASDALDFLHEIGIHEHGGVVVTEPLSAEFKAAKQTAKAAEGDPDDAVIWKVQEDAAEEASHANATYLMFLFVAIALGAIAVITDSAVLVVGAMVVGPDFAVVAALCTGLVFRKWKLALRSLWLVLWSFAVMILLIAAAAWVLQQFGALNTEDILGPRPETAFISTPNIWSFIVALLAGAVGVWAMDTNKSNALVGVFISVTTVPAAGNLALGLALGATNEVSGSLAQLGVNLLGMCIAGVVTLLLQRGVWRRVRNHHSPKITAR